MKLVTSFAKLREDSACEEGYRTLAKGVGGIRSYGQNRDIDLRTILQTNDVNDTLWALRAVKQSYPEKEMLAWLKRLAKNMKEKDWSRWHVRDDLSSYSDWDDLAEDIWLSYCAEEGSKTDAKAKRWLEKQLS